MERIGFKDDSAINFLKGGCAVTKKIAMTLITVLIVAVTMNSVLAYESIYGPTELIHYDKAKAYNGYTLFRPNAPNNTARYTFLIDMEGNVVNTWPLAEALGNPYMLPNGNLLGSANKDVFVGFKELDWNGKVVWEFYEKRENYHPHHDFLRIFNKKLNAFTTIYIANKDFKHDQIIAAGADPNAAKTYDCSQMDTIVEVDMNGNVVWEWGFFEHLVQNIDPKKANYGAIATNPGKLNINWGKPVGEDWNHCNSLDYNEDLDQIAINTVDGEFYVIDHGNTFIPGDPQGSIKLAAGPKGDFLYRFGDPARYDQGQSPSVTKNWTIISSGTKQIGGSHSIQWIRKGLPGAGNFLLFNNAGYVFMSTPQSSLMEINPYLDVNKKNTGKYVNPPDAGYYWLQTDRKRSHKYPRQVSNQIVWMFETKNQQSFYSQMNGGIQRLPNGNTLGCSSSQGQLFEVTPKGEVVWEYINPVTEDGILKKIGDCPSQYNNVFRAYRYGPDFPGLKGKDLSPKGKITDLHAAGKLPVPAPAKK
jgi:hypothetical protein